MDLGSLQTIQVFPKNIYSEKYKINDERNQKKTHTHRPCLNTVSRLKVHIRLRGTSSLYYTPCYTNRSLPWFHSSTLDLSHHPYSYTRDLYTSIRPFPRTEGCHYLTSKIHYKRFSIITLTEVTYTLISYFESNSYQLRLRKDTLNLVWTGLLSIHIKFIDLESKRQRYLILSTRSRKKQGV